MSIEITTDGITKRYSYYPYDAFYVDGKQVKEAWLDGVKYYPKTSADNAMTYKRNRTCPNLLYMAYSSAGLGQGEEVSLGSFECKQVFVTAYDLNDFYYANNNVYGKGFYSRDRSKGTFYGFDTYGLVYLKYNFDNGAIIQNPDRWHIFNRNRFTDESIELFDRLSNGLTLDFGVQNYSQASGESASISKCHQIDDALLVLSIATGSTRYSWGSCVVYFRFDVDANKSINSGYKSIAPIYLSINGAIMSNGQFNNRYGVGTGIVNLISQASERSEYYRSSMFKPTSNDFLI